MYGAHYGPSGPTEVKDINPIGTGLSPAAAAFIAANASPFTNPRDMPTLPKVPDPRNTQNTDTMFIWANVDFPVLSPDISNYSGKPGGNQLIASCADPLAPVPLTWMGGEGVDDSTTRMTPSTWARLYEVHGLDELVAQQHMLADRSKSYRVVGHGLKVWVSDTVTGAQGNISAGQFDFGDARNYTPSDPSSWAQPMQWNDAPGVLNDRGAHGMFLQNRDLAKWRSMIGQSKNEEMGFLSSNEGATVRWTDNNNFEFQPTMHRMCMYPLAVTYGVNGYRKFEVLNFIPTGEVYNEAVSYRITPPTNGWTTGDSTTSTEEINFNDLNRLACVKRHTGGTTGSNKMEVMQYYYQPAGYNNPSGTSSVSYACVNNRDSTLVPYTSSTMTPYFTDPNLSFNKGLYADISGCQPGQIVTVQVVWHIEYVPKGTEPWTGDPSPVDTQFESLAAMLRSREAFPIVVKGHSFFSSLRKAFSRALNATGKIFSQTAPMVQQVLSAIPDPRAQAISFGLSGAERIYQALKRTRDDD